MGKIEDYKQEQALGDHDSSDYYVLVKRTAYYLRSRLPSNIAMEDLVQSGMEGILQAQKAFEL